MKAVHARVADRPAAEAAAVIRRRAAGAHRVHDQLGWAEFVTDSLERGGQVVGFRGVGGDAEGAALATVLAVSSLRATAATRQPLSIR